MIMEDKLNITSQKQTGHTLLQIAGRIDGYWSKHLDEYLDHTLRSGIHNIALDLSEVSYLSSLGIRILIKHAKLFKQVNGGFGLVQVSENVLSILKMAGLDTILSYQSFEAVTKDTSAGELLEMFGFRFEISRLTAQKNTIVTVTGNPEKLKSSGFVKEDCKTVSFHKGKYGIGLGAIGLGFEDCKSRFGEFMGMGDAVVYLPAGKSNSPDYITRTGSLVPEIKMLYGITFEGDIDLEFRFSSDIPDKSLLFSQLLSAAFDISGFDQLFMVMLAETEGMVGMSLQRSPVTEDQKTPSIFAFPGIRDHVIFTTEPAFKNMMSITVGVAIKNQHNPLSGFTRPMLPESNILQHFHSAIFSYHPVKKKEIDLDETIMSLFDQDKILSVIHLMNDSRALNGIGESEFKSGFCRVAKINSITKSS